MRQMAKQLLASGGVNTQHGTEKLTSTSSNETDICPEIQSLTLAARVEDKGGSSQPIPLLPQ